MARINISQILMKRGNTAAAGNYIGPLGELVVDTGLQTIRVQDGVTPGGMAVLATNVQIQTLSAAIANISANTGGLYSNANVASYLTASNIITGINANVTAANLQITNLWSNAGVQSANIATLVANAGVQADAIAGANAAIITANTALKGYVDTQLSTLTNGASTALDTLLEIGTALGNNANFSATMITWLGNVTANTTAANTAIDTLQANLGGYYTWANANVAGLYGSIIAANTAWQTNAGVQADAITSLQANITAANLAIAAASGTYSNTNVAAYLSASTTGNVGAGNLTVVNNFSTNVISANSFTYANGVSILAGITGTYSNANVASYLPTYSGDISANIVKNGYAWTFGTDGALTLPASSGQIGRSGYPDGIDLYNNNGGTGYVRMNYADQSAVWADSGGAHVQTAGANTWDFGTDANLTLPETGYLRVGTGIVAGFASSPAPFISGFSSVSAENFKFQGNGVNILSTVTGTYSNTNVAAYLTINSTVTALQANLGATQIWANANIASLQANLGVTQLWANANIASINANIGGFYTWANTNFGTSSYSNTNANALLSSNTISTINTTGNIKTIANVISPNYLFANGVNILSTITAVANLSTLTGNIGWTAVGANPPTFTTTSNGTKIVLWPSISSTMVDYAIGIEAGNTWFSIPQAANNFGYKWYAGNTTIATLSGNGTLTTGNITTTGNVSATNFVGNGVGLTNVTVSAAGNIVGTSSNVTLVAGNYSYTFDNTGNVTLPANVFVGVTNTFLPNTVASFSANVNYYSQVTLQNKNSGNDATADYIVTANNGSDTVNFLDLGIINSGYDNTTPSNSLGNIVFAADSYIYAQGNTSNANQSGGNLAIGTATTGKTIKFFTGGTTSSAIAMTVANTGVTVGGNLSVSGNIVSTGQNVSLVAGNFTAKFDNTGILTLPTMGGDEGGEINFGIPATNTTLNTRVVVDVYQDRLRIFDGNTKGAYIDLSQASSGVGTLLNNRVSGLVNAGTFVTMDLIKATVTTTGNRGLSLATTTGTFAYSIGGTYGMATPASGGSAGTGTLTTSATASIFNWGFTSTGDISTYILTDTTNSRAYRITLQIGASFNNNMISIERLI